MRSLLPYLLIAAAADAAGRPPPDPSPNPTFPAPYPAPYEGRFPACDAEGVDGFADPCRCACLHWACMRTEWAALTLAEPERVCAGELIKSLKRDDFGYVKAIDGCVRVSSP